jgi:hypothetical protein|tara:strand:- start:6543 stop:6755 length:213 start_codon:yes stop_codon:yes gene_type:complete
MPLTIEQFLHRLADLTDATLLCEILDIESEDIIERFDDLIEDRLEELRTIFDVDFDPLYNLDTLEETEDD